MATNNNVLKLITLCLSILMVVASCGPSVRPGGPEKPPTAELPPDEQNSLAMADYEAMLDMVTEKGKRNVLPELESGYKAVIKKYPDSYLAEESYWRLVELNLRDYYPPKMDEAEGMRQEFIAKHPDSKMINIIDDSMVRYYYRQQQWDRLLKVCAYHIRKFIETDSLETPLFMFYYSDAKMHLKDFVEAEKGYRILINRFPGSHEAGIAKDRLKEVSMSKKLNGK